MVWIHGLGAGIISIDESTMRDTIVDEVRKAREIERLKELMRVHPRPSQPRPPAIPPRVYPGIAVTLGYPPNCE
jgi:hypothetical protein